MIFPCKIFSSSLFILWNVNIQSAICSRCEEFFWFSFRVIEGHGKSHSLLFLVSTCLGTSQVIDTVLGVGDRDEEDQGLALEDLLVRKQAKQIHKQAATVWQVKCCDPLERCLPSLRERFPDEMRIVSQVLKMNQVGREEGGGTGACSRQRQ